MIGDADRSLVAFAPLELVAQAPLGRKNERAESSLPVLAELIAFPSDHLD